MTDTFITYGIFILAAILVIISFIIGSQKMIKIILGNYILGTLCLAANQSTSILITFLQNTSSAKIATFTYGEIAKFLQDGKTTIILVFYVGLLLLMYQKSKIQISLPNDEILKRTFSFLLVPLTVISIILTLEIVILGIQSITPIALQELAKSFTTNPYVYQFIILTPVWILIHGLATVFITSEIKMSIKTDI